MAAALEPTALATKEPEVPSWPEDAAGEGAARTLFRRLDRTGRGVVHEEEVLSLWPMLSQHLDAAPREALLGQLEHRSEPIDGEDWMSLMGALREIVGARRFRSSVRRAEAILAEKRSQCTQPLKRTHLPYVALAVPGAIETTPKGALARGTVLFPPASANSGKVVPLVRPAAALPEDDVVLAPAVAEVVAPQAVPAVAKPVSVGEGAEAKSVLSSAVTEAEQPQSVPSAVEPASADEHGGSKVVLAPPVPEAGPPPAAPAVAQPARADEGSEAKSVLAPVVADAEPPQAVPAVAQPASSDEVGEAKAVLAPAVPEAESPQAAPAVAEAASADAADALREAAASTLLACLDDGRLAAALGLDGEANSALAAETPLQTATADSEAASADDEADALRKAAASTLLACLDDGRLAAALSQDGEDGTAATVADAPFSADGADGDDDDDDSPSTSLPESVAAASVPAPVPAAEAAVTAEATITREAGAASSPAPMEGDSLEALRAMAAATLAATAEDGRLTAALKHDEMQVRRCEDPPFSSRPEVVAAAPETEPAPAAVATATSSSAPLECGNLDTLEALRAMAAATLVATAEDGRLTAALQHECRLGVAPAPPAEASLPPRFDDKDGPPVPEEALAKRMPPPMSPFNDVDVGELEDEQLRREAARSLVEGTVEAGISMAFASPSASACVASPSLFRCDGGNGANSRQLAAETGTSMDRSLATAVNTDLADLRAEAAQVLIASMASGKLDIVASEFLPQPLLSTVAVPAAATALPERNMAVPRETQAATEGASIEGAGETDWGEQVGDDEIDSDGDEESAKVERKIVMDSLFGSVTDGSLDTALKEAAQRAILGPMRLATEDLAEADGEEEMLDILRVELRATIEGASSHQLGHIREAEESHEKGMHDMPSAKCLSEAEAEEQQAHPLVEGKFVVYAGRLVYQEASVERSASRRASDVPAPSSGKAPVQPESFEEDCSSKVLVAGDNASQVPQLVLWQPERFRESLVLAAPPSPLASAQVPGKAAETAEDNAAVSQPPPPPPLVVASSTSRADDEVEGEAKAAPPTPPAIAVLMPEAGANSEGEAMLKAAAAVEPMSALVDVAEAPTSPAAEETPTEQRRSRLAERLAECFQSSQDEKPVPSSTSPSNLGSPSGLAPVLEGSPPDGTVLSRASGRNLESPSSGLAEVDGDEPDMDPVDFAEAQSLERRYLQLGADLGRDGHQDAAGFTQPFIKAKIDEMSGSAPVFRSESELAMSDMGSFPKVGGLGSSRRLSGECAEAPSAAAGEEETPSPLQADLPAEKSKNDGGLHFHLMKQQKRLQDQALAQQQKEEAQLQSQESLKSHVAKQQEELQQEREKNRVVQETLARERSWHDEQRQMLQKRIDNFQAEKVRLQEDQARPVMRRTLTRSSTVAMDMQSLSSLRSSTMGASATGRLPSIPGALASTAPADPGGGGTCGGTPVSLPLLATSPSRTLPPPRLSRVESAPALSGPGSRSSSKRTPEERLEALQRELREERDLHQATVEQLQDVARQLRIASAKVRKPSPPKRPAKRFGVASAAPYAMNQPLPPEIPQPKHKKAFVLPALRQLPPPPPRADLSKAEAEADAVVARQACLSAQSQGLSKKSKSLTRIEAISKLDSLGMNTWHVRRAEKVAKLHDMQAFGSSMWDSFFGWQEESSAVD